MKTLNFGNALAKFVSFLLGRNALTCMWLAIHGLTCMILTFMCDIHG